MNDLRPIDANALKKSITDYHAGLFPRYISKVVDAEIEDIKDIIDEQITLDYAPVVHGEWISMVFTDTGKPAGYNCSECGLGARKKFAYCHCGAKMDGGKKDG